MQTKKRHEQTEMMILPALDDFVPQDHYLRRLNRVLDLSFVHETVRGCYCQENGRGSIDPEVIIRLFLLQAITGIVHVRRLMNEVYVNLAYRWFIGYRVDEPLPDHSTLSKALDRFGDEVFNELFSRSIAQCRKSGLIEGKVLHVDATTIRADIDKHKVNQPESSDKDARYGHFPDGTIQPGYKQQTVVDDHTGVIIALSVGAANKEDHQLLMASIDAATERLGSSPEVVCADGGYASGVNAAACEEREIRLVSPPQPVPENQAGHYTVDQFVYDEKLDEFVCPAGERLRYAGRTGREGQRRYRGRQKICRRCVLKSACTQSDVRCLTVSPAHGALVRLRADHRREDFQRLYRRRAPVIEGVFAEAKQWHGLRRAWRRGLAKMRIQCLLVAAVINFKRLIALFSPLQPLSEALQTVLVALWSYLITIITFHGICDTARKTPPQTVHRTI
jgi:transposase